MGTATEYTLRQIQTLLEKIDDLQQALSSIAGDQLRVDQVTAADPPFADITISHLRDNICGLAPEETNLWGVWDRLNYIKIAIEKLDDLQQALHSIAGDELDVIVESSALPTGAATAAKQDSILAELQEKLETADLNLDGDGDVQVDVKTLPKVIAAVLMFYLSHQTAEAYIHSLCVYNGKLYAGSYPGGKVFVFDGSTWSESYDSTETYIYSLCVYNGKLYASSGTGGKVFVFDGSTWSESYDSTETHIWSLCVYNGKLYAGSEPSGNIYEGRVELWTTN